MSRTASPGRRIAGRAGLLLTVGSALFGLAVLAVLVDGIARQGIDPEADPGSDLDPDGGPDLDGGLVWDDLGQLVHGR